MQKGKDQLQEPSHTDVCLWLDYYGELLSMRQRELLKLYFDEDWSLSEIANYTGLSRQGIHEQVRRGVTRLCDLEDALELAARDGRTKELIESAIGQYESSDQQGLRQTLDTLLKLVERGTEGQGDGHGAL